MKQSSFPPFVPVAHDPLLSVPSAQIGAGTGEPFSPQKCRQGRARVLNTAKEVFGCPEKTERWLHRPSLALSGKTPLELLDTEDGLSAVEMLLGHIAHGIAA